MASHVVSLLSSNNPITILLSYVVEHINHLLMCPLFLAANPLKSSIQTSRVPQLSHEIVIDTYVLFVDHFTKYMWFYPLKNKSDVHEVFVWFQSIVEKFFDTKIVSLYSDNCREYIALKHTLAKLGISRFITPLYTP